MDIFVPNLTQTSLVSDGINSSLSWDNLTLSERRIIEAVVFTGSPEEARKKLSMTHSTFYRKWSWLKVYYNDLIKDFPKRAGEILISQSMRAAQELGNELDSENEKTRHAAATEILDRTLSREPVEVGLKRRITLEEFITPPDTFTRVNLPNTEPAEEDQMIEGHVKDLPATSAKQITPDELDEEII